MEEIALARPQQSQTSGSAVSPAAVSAGISRDATVRDARVHGSLLILAELVRFPFI